MAETTRGGGMSCREESDYRIIGPCHWATSDGMDRVQRSTVRKGLFRFSFFAYDIAYSSSSFFQRLFGSTVRQVGGRVWVGNHMSPNDNGGIQDRFQNQRHYR